MSENDNNQKSDLLNTVMEVIHGKQGKNLNELVSLLALSNLLGIITFLNSQDLNTGMGTFAKSGNSDLKEMAMNLLSSMGSGSSDKKINPAMLVNLLKAMSSGENPSPEIKSGEKSEDKKKT